MKVKVVVDGSLARELEGEPANSVLAQMRGLIAKPPPPSGQGLMLRGRRIHTFGMSYPIDAVYISAVGEVLKVATHRPNMLGPRVGRARWIFEMAEGEASFCGIVTGAMIEWEG